MMPPAETGGQVSKAYAPSWSAKVVALSKWLREADLPEPPLPSPAPVDLAFQLTLDLAAQEVGDRVAPVVTSHYPAMDALEPAGKIRVIWVLSEPLQPVSLDSQKIRVVGEQLGLLAGVASYDANRWWVMWERREPLHQEQVYANLDAGAVGDLAGNELRKPSTVRFRVR
ncbi:MAG: Ig-like domain-containing protein [Thermoanaerobaculaceae bacterium]